MSEKVLIIGALSTSLVNFRGSLLRELVTSGYEVHAAANELSKDKKSNQRLTDMGVFAHSVPMVRTGVNPIKDLYTFFSLVMLYWKLQPDVVLAYTSKPVIWGGLASCFSLNAKFFAMITGLGYAFTGEAVGKRLLIKYVIQMLYKMGLHNASAVIFQNPDDATEFRKLRLISNDKKTVVVNGSGVNLDDFPLSDLPQGQINFLMIARLLGDKGVREYVDAGKLLNNDHISAHLHLVGPADSNPDARSQDEIKTWQNLEWFTWHGSSDDVRPYIKNSRVYVLPSYREGTPRTVLEAMSMGRPIITTDTPGCRETVINGDNGFLVPIKNSKELALAMRKFIDSPDLAISMGKKSRNIVERKYDIKKVNPVMIKALGLDEN